MRNRPAARYSRIRAASIPKKHASGLDRVDIRELEKVRIHWRDDVGIRTDAQAGQAMNAAHELAITAGIVRSPTPALLWEKILTAKLRTLILWRNRHGRYSETAESPVVVTATSCWVFVVCQSCEEEFWRIGRAVGENGRQPDKAAGADEHKEQEESCSFHTFGILRADTIAISN